ncbi:lectin [Paenibacillus sp. HJL G12]|uniref:Intimin n=1 Tax=Paenibacillus dendrobii TaxID=2691084 RepID=A0A7X3ILF6_9BACL|nr:S-layer homology domain-containing protein [Paenibacillus dendrobii]MWV46122.1 lectin [Paenibacillus dendrobii]
MIQAVKLRPLLIVICMLVATLQPMTAAVYADPVDKWVTYKIDNFSNSKQVDLFAINGQAKVVTDSKQRKILRLTEAKGNQFGTAFNKKLIAAGNHYSFSTYFKFRLNGDNPQASPADGITFTVQAQSNSAGKVGEGIGYGGITPSFAIKYDTYKNASPVNDPSDNYIGLAVNGSVNNTNPSWYTTKLNGIKLSGGKDLSSWIDYDGASKVVKVYLSNDDTRPEVPVLTTSGINLEGIFDGYPGVYAGFTSATGGSMETHDIISWYFTNSPDPIDTGNEDYVYKQAPTDVRIQVVPTGDPGKYEVTGTAFDVNGDPVEGAPMTFYSEEGVLLTPSQQTNTSGQAKTILDFGSAPPSGEIKVVTVGGAYATIPKPPVLEAGTTPQTANTLSWTTVTGATYYSLYKDNVLIVPRIDGTTTYTLQGTDLDDVSRYTVTAVLENPVGQIETLPSNSVTIGLYLDQKNYELNTNPEKAEYQHQTVVTSVYTDGTRDVTLEGTTFVIKDPSIASVNSEGLITAVGAGTTVIDAVYNGKSVQAVIKVTIDAPVMQASSVTSTTAELSWNAVPGAQTYNIYDGSGKLVADGLTGSKYALAGLKPNTTQTYTITAVSNGIESGSSLPVKVQTSASSLRDLFIDPASITLKPGDEHTPKVTAVYAADESIENVTGKATYTSSDPSVATVDANGRVIAVSPGLAIITASYDGKSVSETVQVKIQEQPYELDLTVTPDSVLADGKSPVHVTAKVTDSEGKPAAGVPVEITLDSGKTVTQVTNEEGIAVWTYIPDALQGTTPSHDTITAKITDHGTNTTIQSSAGIDYFPAAIDGIIIDQVSGKPVAGAKITVESDFNHDGTPDFTAEVMTGEDGSYHIPVPRGDYTYSLNIQTPVQVGGQQVTLTETKEVTLGTIQPGQTIKPVNTLKGQLFIVPAAGGAHAPSLSDLLGNGEAYAVLKGLDGSNFEKELRIGQDGTFSMEQVPKGRYEISYQLKTPEGALLAGPSSIVNVDMSQDGQTSIVYSLIDPYGVVTDASTGNVLSGADVQLYWADTQLNQKNGRIPNTPVSLPALPGFAPNQNANPQSTDAAGQYAWMVYPQGDYYIIAKKDGYFAYDTRQAKPNVPANGSDSYIQDGIIHVGQSIINLDFAMQPRPTTSSGGSSTSVSTPSQGELTLNLSVDKKQVKEGEPSTIKIDYSNKTTSAVNGAVIKVTIPEGAELINAGGGTVEGRTVSWSIGSLKAGGTGSFQIEVKWGMLHSEQVQYEIVGQLLAGGSSKKASVQVQVFSDRFGQLKHQRYILGYPDGKFHSDGSLSRAELAAIVARLSDKTEVHATTFKDIRKGHWATDYIQIATSQGYFNGYADQTFRPDAPVTRGELASVLARFLKLDSSSAVNHHFNDLSGSWAANSIEALYRNNLLSGYPDGTFRPNAKITRAEAVTLINRALYRGPLTGLDPIFPDVSTGFWGFGDVQEATISHESIRNDDGSETWKASLQDDIK